MNIIEACDDPNLFAQWFRDPQDWSAWRSFLSALFGLPMEEEQLETFKRHTGRQEAPEGPFSEAWLITGRRGGKSFNMALVAVYLGTFRDYRPYLAPGERATVAVIAADRRQARVVLRYITAMLTRIPILQAMIDRETAESFDLDNGVTIEVGTASLRSTRGYTYAAVLCDEIAFWRSEDSANPDFEILDAIRPGMATIPGAMLICASSPYARRGALWDAFKRYWSKDGKPLVWKATTREMNPSVRQETVDAALERDHAIASAEWLAEFRADIEAFVTIEVVERCVEPDVFERQYSSGHRYHAFVDPSGGSNDAMTLAIAHREGDECVLDVMRERKPPFSPEGVVADFVDVLRAYGISEVTGDRYAGEWPRQQFRKLGIAYQPCDMPRSELYRDLLPLLNSKTAVLLDSDRLVNQLVSLERRVARGGREIIDHPPHGHDDLANAVAGALALVSLKARNIIISPATFVY